MLPRENTVTANGWAWRIAWFATLLFPVALIYSRLGMEVLCGLIGLLFLWHSYRTREWQWLKNPIIAVGLLSWLWLSLAVSPFSLNTGESWRPSLPWIRYLLFYAALSHWVLTTRRALGSVAAVLAFVLTAVVVDALWQNITGVSLSGHSILENGRLSGPLDNIKVGIFLSRLLLPAAGLLFYFLVMRRFGAHAVLLLVTAAAATILLSGERSPFFILMLGLMVSAALIMTVKRRWRYICLLGLGVLAAGSYLLIRSQELIHIRMIALGDTLAHFPESVYGQLFQAGLVIGREHWLTGGGIKSFFGLCVQLQRGYCDLHPHNPYIQWFAEAGLMGLLLFVAFVIALARRCFLAWRTAQGNEKMLAACAAGHLVVLYFPLAVTQSVFSNWPGLLLWYSLGISIASLNLIGASQSNTSRS